MDQTVKKEDAICNEDIVGRIKEEELEWCSCKQESKDESKHDCKQEIKEEAVEQAGRTLEEHIDNALQTGSLGIAVDASFLHEDEYIQKRIKREANKENAVNSDETERDREGGEPANKKQRTDNEIKNDTSVPVSKDKIMKCGQCSTFIYIKQHSLKLHQIVHTTEPPYQCTDCQYETANTGNFNMHIRCHSNDKPYPCQYCNYCAIQAGNIRRHINRRHPTSGIICCSLCNYIANSSAMMIQHNENVHADGKCTMKCPVCVFTYKKPETMKLHNDIIHSTKRPYKCSVCGYKTSHAAHFNDHIRTHTDDRLYTCQYCDSCFIKPSDLQKHLNSRIHQTK